MDDDVGNDPRWRKADGVTCVAAFLTLCAMAPLVFLFDPRSISSGWCQAIGLFIALPLFATTVVVGLLQRRVWDMLKREYVRRRAEDERNRHRLQILADPETPRKLAALRREAQETRARLDAKSAELEALRVHERFWWGEWERVKVNIPAMIRGSERELAVDGVATAVEHCSYFGLVTSIAAKERGELVSDLWLMDAELSEYRRDPQLRRLLDTTARL